MGMWDYYRPKRRYRCPLCNGKLVDWQGKNGALRNLFLYVEGYKHPFVLHDTDFSKIDEADIEGLPQEKSLVLPKEFWIYGDCEQCQAMWDAKCATEDDVWKATVLVTPENFDEIVSESDPFRRGMPLELEYNHRAYAKYLAKKYSTSA